MKKPHAPSGKDAALISAMQNLERSVDKLPRRFEYVIHPGKHLFVAYLRGIFYGLGAITAFAVFIPIILWGLHRIAWVPIIGDIVTKVATQVEHMQPGPPR